MPSKKTIPWSLRQLCVKVALMSITVFIGLLCGYHDSYNSFYIAVLVQAANNAYDSFGLLNGYNRFITILQFLSFLGAIASIVIAILSFAGVLTGSPVQAYIVIGMLSVPILHFLIEIFVMIITEKY